MAGVIETKSGVFIDPTDPDPALVRIEDIAYAAARIARFSGFVEFVVGEHCLEVAAILAAWQEPPLTQLHGLTHDAAECLGLLDFARPVKDAIPGYRKIEKHAMRRIHQGLKLPEPTVDAFGIIKRADNVSLVSEAQRDLPSRADHPYWKWWMTADLLREVDALWLVMQSVQLRITTVEHEEQVTRKAAISKLFLDSYHELRREANV